MYQVFRILMYVLFKTFEQNCSYFVTFWEYLIDFNYLTLIGIIQKNDCFIFLFFRVHNKFIYKCHHNTLFYIIRDHVLLTYMLKETYIHLCIINIFMFVCVHKCI